MRTFKDRYNELRNSIGDDDAFAILIDDYKKVFVHRFKYSHRNRRKKYKRKCKEGNVELLAKYVDGFLYGIRKPETIKGE